MMIQKFPVKRNMPFYREKLFMGIGFHQQTVILPIS